MPEWASEDGRPPRSPRSRSNIRPQALRLAEGTEGDQDRPAEQELHRGRSEQVDAVPQPPHENGAPSRRRGGQQRQSDAFGVVAPELAAATTTTPPRAWPALPRSRSDPRSANQSQPAAVRTSSWPLASTEATAASARLAGRYIAPKASVALASDSTSTTASGGRPALGSSVGLPAPPISARAPASKRGAGSGNETWMRTKQSPHTMATRAATTADRMSIRFAILPDGCEALDAGRSLDGNLGVTPRPFHGRLASWRANSHHRLSPPPHRRLSVAQ